MRAGALTIIEGTIPKTLGKTYRINAKGEVEKTTAGELVEGSFRVETFSDVRQLAALLEGLTTSNALCASLPKNGAVQGRIVTKAALSGGESAITRSKEHFAFAVRPAVLVLDYDPSGAALSREALWTLLTDNCPGLRGAGVLWWSSGSSFIYRGDEEVAGLRGQRIYILIADASDTERFCEALAKRLWLAGHGHIAVSSSGAKLVRGVFDQSMAQPARLDFAAGAVCLDGLAQRRGSCFYQRCQQ